MLYSYKSSKIFFIFILLSIFILSCDKKNEETEEDGETLIYLKNLVKEEDASALGAYNELNYFLQARDDFYEQRYKSSFNALLKVLYYYSPSSYEAEALYLIGQIIPIIIKEEPTYIQESYENIYSQMTNNSQSDEELSIENFYSFLGLEYKDNKFKYNGEPLKRILDDESVSLIPKDDIYYYLSKQRYQKIEDEDDKNNFLLNIHRLSFLSDMYRTSDIQKFIFDNENYFPKNLPFKLSYNENKKYNDLVKKLEERVENITPEINEKSYVTGDKVRIRDRVPKSSIDDGPTLYYLNNYDTVEVLRRFKRKQKGKSEEDEWLLIKYDSPYGEIIGFSYAKYFEDANKIDEKLYNIFSTAVTNYYSHKYIDAANGFSYVLSQDSTNYFTDKACYLLWKVNNAIGPLVTSKQTLYYDYAKKHPNYFMYDEDKGILKSSMLLYSYLVSIMPDSTLKFKISGESDEI